MNHSTTKLLTVLGLSAFLLMFSLTLGPGLSQQDPAVQQQAGQSPEADSDSAGSVPGNLRIGFYTVPEDPDKDTVLDPPPLPPEAEDYEKSAEYGEKLFSSKGCVSCHAIRGMGGEVGPDLSSVGLRRNYEWMQNLITNPQSVQPDSIMGQYIRGYPGDAEALARFLSHQRSRYTVSPSSYEYATGVGIGLPWEKPEGTRWEIMRALQGLEMDPDRQIPTAAELQGEGGH